jgi:flagellar basal-body rod modification protein FlgD
MTIDAVGVTGNTDTSVPANATVDQNAFMKILLTQLRFQDPLKPMDNQQFLAQLAQFSALEINRQQSAKIDTLLQMNSSSQAIGLLGQQVEVNGQSAGVGQVIAVTFNSDGPALTVKTPSGDITGVQMRNISLIQKGS